MRIIYALATLSSTIIGVGLFALPYITLEVGAWTMLGYFLVLGALVILIHLFYGEVALLTPDFKRLPGFAEIHLGKTAKKIAFFSTILGLFGAILAYLIIGGEFLKGLLSPVFGGGSLIYTFLYFSLGALIIFLGVKTIARVEFLALILFILSLIFIFSEGRFLIEIDNLFLGEINSGNWFLPYGVILFSLWGAALVPEVEEILGKDKRKIIKVIPFAILIPIFVYLFFIFIILGICGNLTTESAITGLINLLPPRVVNLALFFGFLATFTSFISLGLTLKKTFWYDFKINKNFAWLLTCFIPLILYLFGFQDFIKTISLVGGVMLGIDGILILLMYSKLQNKAQKLIIKSRLLVYFLFLILLGGIVYEIIYFIK